MVKKKINKVKQNDGKFKTILRKKGVHISIILAVISIALSAVFYFIPNTTEPCIQGASGNVYKDCLMNFEITKPNRDWKFHYDFNINVPKFEILFPGQSIVEMVLAERTNNEQVVVIVFDDEVNLDLRKFIETEIDYAKKANLPLEITYKMPSENKKEDEITIDTKFFNNYEQEKLLKIFKEKIIKKNGLIYVIHSQIRSMDNVSEKTKTEVIDVFDSFKFLPTNNLTL